MVSARTPATTLLSVGGVEVTVVATLWFISVSARAKTQMSFVGSVEYHEEMTPMEEEKIREEGEMVADVVEEEDTSGKPPLRPKDEKGTWLIGGTLCFVTDMFGGRVGGLNNDGISGDKFEGLLKGLIVTGLNGRGVDLNLGQEGGIGRGSSSGPGIFYGGGKSKGGNDSAFVKGRCGDFAIGFTSGAN